jgi:hypothetical protein
MSIKSNNTNNKQEALFEEVLRRISVKAFDALLKCGVRDITGFLRLTEKELIRAVLDINITNELLTIQQLLRNQLSKLHKEDTFEIDSNMDKEQQLQSDNDLDVIINKSHNHLGTLIPDELLNALLPDTHNFLLSNQITTCEQFLAFQNDDISKLKNVGITTLKDLHRLYKKLIRLYPNLENNIKDIHGVEIKVKSYEPEIIVTESDENSGILLPDSFLSGLSKYAYDIMTYYKFTTYEQLFSFFDSDYLNIKGEIDASTAKELHQFKIKINNEYLNLADNSNNITLDSPIPPDLLNCMSVFTDNVIEIFHIETCEEFISFYNSDFITLKENVGPIVIENINFLYKEIIERFPTLKYNIDHLNFVEDINEYVNDTNIIKTPWNSAFIESWDDDKPKYNKHSVTPIPEELLRVLSTRAYNVLLRENITTCEQILELNKDDLFNLKNIGITSINDIQRLQKNIIKWYPEFKNVTRNYFLYSVPNGTYHPFIKVHDVNSNKNKPSIPEEWSILSQSLYDILNYKQSLLSSIQNIQLDEMHTIEDLKIYNNDTKQLRVISLFPEDNTELIYSISLNYLIEADLSEETFKSLVNFLLNDSGCIKKQLKDIISENIIFADLSIENINSFIVKDLPVDFKKNIIKDYPNDNNLIIYNQNIVKWQDVAQLSEKDIIDTYGFTMAGLRLIHQIWDLKDKAVKLNEEISKGLPIEAYDSFEQLVHDFIQTIVNNKRESRILMGRLGVLDGRKWTLGELGQKENLTRERIRQIEQKKIPLIKSDKSINQLKRLWYIVTDILTVSGGVCCVSEISEYLKKYCEWTLLPTDVAMASLINLNTKFEINFTPPIRIILPEYQCLSCNKIRTKLTESVNNSNDGTLLFDEAINVLNSFCSKNNCNISSCIPLFSKGFLYTIIDEQDDIIIENSIFYNRHSWTLNHGKLIDMIEAILLQSGRAMHFTDVCSEIRQIRPDETLSENNIHSRICTIKNALLWDRGTYIHRNHVNIPTDLISEIEKDVIKHLHEDVLYIYISGIFDKYQSSLIENRISSESALYSCLRESNNPKLIFPEYPCIALKDWWEERKSFPTVLEEYIKDKEDVVSLDEIRNFAINMMCINEQLLYMHLNSIPNLLRVNKGEYLHCDNFYIKNNALEPIVTYIENIIDVTTHVSIVKIFNDKKITCKMIGINTPTLLYSLLKQLYGDRFNLIHYPSIQKNQNMMQTDRHSSIYSEIVNSIREKNTICNLTLLYDYYCEKLGYSYNYIRSLRNDKEIIYYSDGTVLHIETIKWTENKQLQLENIASNLLYDRQNAGKPFGLSTYLFEYLYDLLPELPEYISWTPTLIVELLSRSDSFRIIGSQRNAFISIPNSFGIESLDDLLYYILNTEYDGAENLNIFVKNIHDAGIIQKNLTPSMLGADSRVIIDGNVIRLTEINPNVT